MICILIFIAHFAFPTVANRLQMLADAGPILCASSLPLSDYQYLYAALVCGIPLAPSVDKRLFIDSGLIHVMVVSGSHLAFLESLIELSHIKWLRTGPLLAGYCYLTGFQAPVMRAFFRRLIGPESKRRLGLTSLQIEAVAIATALSVYPPWIKSQSFLMSWMCGLALQSPRILKRFQVVEQAVKVYAFLLPFCAASPLTVGWNILLAPLVGYLLFPLCLLVMICPPLTGLTDYLWQALLGVLKQGPLGTPFLLHIGSGWLIALPFVVHGVLIAGEISWRRSSAYSSSY